MRVHGLGAVQFRQDGFGKLFAKFHPHLVERVDAPDDTLREDFMFIQRDERAERCGGQLLVKEGIGRAVSWKGLGAGEEFQFRAGVTLGGELCPGFFGGAAFHQSFGLRQKV